MDKTERAPRARPLAEQARGWVVLAVTVALLAESAWDGRAEPQLLLAVLRLLVAA